MKETRNPFIISLWQNSNACGYEAVENWTVLIGLRMLYIMWEYKKNRKVTE